MYPVCEGSDLDLDYLSVLNTSQSNDKWDDFNIDARWKIIFALDRDQTLLRCVNFKKLFMSLDVSSLLAT